MIGRKFIRRALVALTFVGVSGSAAAFSYGILAAGVLVAAIAVVAAPYVGIALTAAEIAGVMGAATVHSAVAAYVFGQPLKPSPSMPPVMVSMINAAPNTGKPVKVNLAPMSAAAKSKFQAAKTAQTAAAAVTPAPATPASGKEAAEASARSQLQAALAYYKGYGSNGSANIGIECTDQAPTNYRMDCGVVCYSSCQVPPYQYPTGASVNYTAPKPAVNCPTGSHQVGSACAVNNDPSQDTVVNDGSSTPQWNPAGFPDDARLSADGSTLSRAQSNSDGTTTSSNVTLQPDGSLNIVDSTYNPATGQTVHTGYAVDTNGVVQSVGAAVSPGNFSGLPNTGVTFPNGNTPNGTGGSGGGGGCGSKEKPNCDINFGTPDAGPVIPGADSSEADAALGTTVFDGLTSFQLPAHASECPTMSVPTDFFGKAGNSVSTQAACDFVDTNRASLSSIFILIWAIAALLLILSA